MPGFINEPARKVKIWRECDVVVVGGGPGGVGSAIAAARNGAKTILIERYGHLGGMATGGLVNIIPNLSDMSGKQHIFGIVQEMLDRLDKRGGRPTPPKNTGEPSIKKSWTITSMPTWGGFTCARTSTGTQNARSIQQSSTRRYLKMSSTTWCWKAARKCCCIPGASSPSWMATPPRALSSRASPGGRRFSQGGHRFHRRRRYVRAGGGGVRRYAR